VVVAAAIVARIHNAFAFPALADFDGPGHALNYLALYEGRLPDPASWSGFHPPLAYALGAAVWHLLPDAVPVHAALRLLSAAAGFGAVAIVWRTLPRFVSPADAAVSAALVACAPVFAIATSMLGNETLCALFATAALARTTEIPDDGRKASQHGVGTVALAALAALTKSTGLAVVAIVGLTYLWRLRGGMRLRGALLMSGVAALLLAPHYGRLLIEGQPIASIVSGGVAGAAASQMALQPPGVRHLFDYVSFPVAALVAPFKDGEGMARSVPGLLYATTWADGQGEFLPSRLRGVVAAASVSALLGLVPTVLAVRGLVTLLRDPILRARAGAALAYAALLFAAFLAQTWIVPRFSAVKASYLLSATLPASIALAVGVGRLRRPAIARATLLGIAAYATFLTWYAWWS
jgi:hypothetical protein